MSSTTSASPHVAGMERLRGTLLAGIGAQLAGHPDVALLTYPNHWNLGDTAIWAGQCAALDRLGVRAAYVADFRTYDRDDLRRTVPDGPILLSGGGNFGDVYPNEQGLRERVIDDFPERTMLQLPQSLWFRSDRALDDVRRRLERCRGFVLMVRDRRSLELARARLPVPVHLLPDMAFALPDLGDRRRAPSTDVLWLLRRDIEAADGVERRAIASDGAGSVRDWTRPPAGLAASDWTTFIRALLRSWLLAHLPRRGLSGGAIRVRRSFERLAHLRLAIACRLLSEGRVLVTDRLHGHVLALLLGIEHVCMDSRNGKVRQFYATWTAGDPLARWADTPADARASARELLAAPAHPV